MFGHWDMRGNIMVYRLLSECDCWVSVCMCSDDRCTERTNLNVFLIERETSNRLNTNRRVQAPIEKAIGISVAFLFVVQPSSLTTFHMLNIGCIHTCIGACTRFWHAVCVRSQVGAHKLYHFYSNHNNRLCIDWRPHNKSDKSTRLLLYSLTWLNALQTEKEKKPQKPKSRFQSILVLKVVKVYLHVIRITYQNAAHNHDATTHRCSMN